MTWIDMRRRCLNPTRHNYPHYGGRGIRIHPEWIENYVAFESYVLSTLGPRPNRRYTLDRIDNDGHYEPGNLRWATQKIQIANRRRAA